MHKLKSESAFRSSNGTKSFGVACPVDTTLDNIKADIGPQVEIDGAVYNVKGIECFCIERQRKGISIGILTDAPWDGKGG